MKILLHEKEHKGCTVAQSANLGVLPAKNKTKQDKKKKERKNKQTNKQANKQAKTDKLWTFFLFIILKSLTRQTR